MAKNNNLQLATEALSVTPCCPICHYPISKIVKALIKGGKRPAPGPHSFTCKCGITHSEVERFGPPENVIAKMIMKNETDWYLVMDGV